MDILYLRSNFILWKLRDWLCIEKVNMYSENIGIFSLVLYVVR